VYNNLIDFFQYEILYFLWNFLFIKKSLGVNMFFVLNDFYKNQERHLKKSFKKLRKKNWGRAKKISNFG